MAVFDVHRGYLCVCDSGPGMDRVAAVALRVTDIDTDARQARVAARLQHLEQECRRALRVFDMLLRRLRAEPAALPGGGP